MYYVKAEIAEGVTIRADITDESVFTVCPGCGIEHQVDLQSIITNDQFDFYGTSTYCPECSKKWLAEHASAAQ